MSHLNKFISSSILCAIAILFSGCSEPASVEKPNAENPVADSEQVKETVTEETEITISQETEEEVEEPTETPQESAEFKAPFPDRVNLFQAPKRQNTGLARIKKGSQETSVELLGFVNVDMQRAVLAVNGLVAPIAEGGKHSGIEVISIQPPTLVLQRGRQRWQATLEN